MRVTAFMLLLLAPLSATAQPYGAVWLTPATESGFDPSCLFVDNASVEVCDVAVVVAVDGSWSALENFRVGTFVSWSWLADLSPHTVMGTSPAGASILFASCVGPRTVVMTIRFLCPGASACGQLYLMSAPGAAAPTLVSCDGASQLGAGGGTLTVNGVFDVPPGGFDPDCYCATVPVEESTWGRIKSLYGP